MDSFYITLISNSSKDMNPYNCSSSFCNNFPKRFELFDDFEVALTKITFPLTLKNMYSDRSMAWIKTGNSINKRSVLTEEYNNNIHSILSKLENDFERTFTFSLQDGRVVIKNESADDTECLRLSSTLAAQLGFIHQEEFLCGEHKASHNFDLDAGVPHQLFFYTNIIKPQIYGDKFLQIIQSTVIERKDLFYGSSKEINFSNLQYFPTSVRDFDQIFFNIKDNNGFLAPFVSGVCTVTLHFRRAAC
jgi:hypothetical protein